jgi:hypothetical protein
LYQYGGGDKLARLVLILISMKAFSLCRLRRLSLGWLGTCALGFSLGQTALAAERGAWSEKLVRSDKIDSPDGRTSDLLFFDPAAGNFSVGVDHLTKKIVSFSGSFRAVPPNLFTTLEKHVASLKSKRGVQKANVERVNYEANGRDDRVFNLELDRVNVGAKSSTYQALMNANNATITLKTRREASGVSLYVGIEFIEQNTRHELTILNWSVLGRKTNLARSR